MTAVLYNNLIMVFRMLLAGACGGVIGYGRESRNKAAGFRTHVIISVSAALMMLISKYGFDDVLVSDMYRLDPSRMAAAVVAAIGFLGSGVIMVRNRSVSGITTSAGIWAALGVGLAVGSGLIFLGIAATIMVCLVESVLGRGGVLAVKLYPTLITVRICGGKAQMDKLKNIIESKGFKVHRFDYHFKEQDEIEATVAVYVPKGHNIAELFDIHEDWLTRMEASGSL